MYFIKVYIYLHILIISIDIKLGVSGTPEGIYSAGVGTIFINKTGSASTTLFLKVSGSGNTGWVAK